MDKKDGWVAMVDFSGPSIGTMVGERKESRGRTRDGRSALWYAAMQSGTLYDYFARPRQGHPMAR